MNGQKIAVALCILETDDEYLLIHRGKKKTTKEECVNQYIPIGGKLEPFETPEEGCCREVKEETGITIESPNLLGILTETSPLEKYNWVDYVFYKKIEKQPISNCDEGNLIWIPKTKITLLDTPEIDQKMYEYLIKKQKFIISAVYNESLNLLKAYEYIEGINLK